MASYMLQHFWTICSIFKPIPHIVKPPPLAEIILDYRGGGWVNFSRTIYQDWQFYEYKNVRDANFSRTKASPQTNMLAIYNVDSLNTSLLENSSKTIWRQNIINMRNGEPKKYALRRKKWQVLTKRISAS